MKEEGFKDIRTSIINRQNTFAQYIATRPLLDLYEETNQIGGARVSRRWWFQKGIDWEKDKVMVVETDSESETDKDKEEARRTASGGERLKWGGKEWSECRPVE